MSAYFTIIEGDEFIDARGYPCAGWTGFSVGPFPTAEAASAWLVEHDMSGRHQLLHPPHVLSAIRHGYVPTVG